MLEFKAQNDQLKKAFGIVALAADDKQDSVWSHTRFKITEDTLELHSTDKDRIAVATCTVFDVQGDVVEFTSDPKKLAALLSSSDSDTVRFVFNEEKKTLKVFASENKESYLSFPSIDPEKLSLDNKLDDAFEVKTFNAGVFLTGLRFIQGFLPPDDRDKKFARMYITDGVLYGSNGSVKVGAFKSPEFEDLDGLIFRRPMLSPIATMIDRVNPTNVIIKTTSNLVMVFSDDSKYGFGFLKAVDEPIKFPINLDNPDTDHFNVDKTMLLRKLNRLAIASSGNLGIKGILKEKELEMSTLSDRSSIERLDYIKASLSEEKTFIADYKLMKTVVGLFQAPDVNIFVDKSKGTIISEGQLEIQEKGQEEPTIKEFRAVAVMSMARSVGA